MMMMMMMIQLMWNMKCFVIPVITGVTVLTTKGPKNICNNTRKAFNKFCTRDIESNKENCYNVKIEA
jgi:hypothetical protein